MEEKLDKVLAEVSMEEFKDFLESVTGSEDIMNAMFNDMVMEVLKNQHRAYDEETDTLVFTLNHLLNATAIECIEFIKK